mgnify:FL=1
MIAKPDIFCVDRATFPHLTGVGIASDGVWDVLSNDAVFTILSGAGIQRVDVAMFEAADNDRTPDGHISKAAMLLKKEVEDQLKGISRQVVDAAVAKRSRDDCTFICAVFNDEDGDDTSAGE